MLVIPPYTLIRSKRTTIALVVNRDATLTVRAPMRVSQACIETLLAGRNSWIRAKQEYMAQSFKKIEKKQWAEGEEFLYLGRAYHLRIGMNKQIVHNEEAQELYFPEKFLASKEIKTIAWYKKQAQEVLGDRIVVYNHITGLAHTKLTITSAQGRWGSCRGSAVNFTWRLAMVPIPLIDYVIVHELCHIKEKNHGEKFWNMVEKFMPDYKDRQKLLRTYNNTFEV